MKTSDTNNLSASPTADSRYIDAVVYLRGRIESVHNQLVALQRRAEPLCLEAPPLPSSVEVGPTPPVTVVEGLPPTPLASILLELSRDLDALQYGLFLLNDRLVV